MKKLLAIVAAAAFLPVAAGAANESSAVKRLKKATSVLNQAKVTIPQDMLARAQCIAVLPGVKRGAFIFGAAYGAGFASCRTARGWSAPAGIDMESGSVGLQAGGQEADYVILIMGHDARRELLNSDLKFTAHAAAAAGSSGPSTDETASNVVVWARSGGAFAGVDVSGARLTQDSSANKALYGHKMPNSLILEGRVQPPPAAREFGQALPRHAAARPRQARQPHAAAPGAPQPGAQQHPAQPAQPRTQAQPGTQAQPAQPSRQP